MTTEGRRIFNEEDIVQWCTDLSSGTSERTQKWAQTTLRQWLRTSNVCRFDRVVRQEDIRSPLWSMLYPSGTQENGKEAPYPKVVWANMAQAPEWAQRVYEIGDPLWWWFKPEGELEHTIMHRIDYVEAHPPQRENYQYTMEQVIEGVVKWDDQMARQAELANLYLDTLEIDAPLLHELGFKMYFLKSKAALENEGKYMGHCTNSSSHLYHAADRDILSIRSAETSLSVYTLEMRYKSSVYSGHSLDDCHIKDHLNMLNSEDSWIAQLRGRFNARPGPDILDTVSEQVRQLWNTYPSASAYWRAKTFLDGKTLTAFKRAPGTIRIPSTIHRLGVADEMDFYDHQIDFMRRRAQGTTISTVSVFDFEPTSGATSRTMRETVIDLARLRLRKPTPEEICDRLGIQPQVVDAGVRAFSFYTQRVGRALRGALDGVYYDPAGFDRWLLIDSYAQLERRWMDLPAEYDGNVNKARRELVDRLPFLNNSTTRPYHYVWDNDKVFEPSTLSRSLFPISHRKVAQTWAANPFSQPLKKGKKDGK